MRTAPRRPVPTRSELHASQLDVLDRVARLFRREHQLENLFSAVLALLHEELGLEHGLVAVHDEDNECLQILSVHGDAALQKRVGKPRYREGEGILGSILRSGKSVVLGRIASEPSFLDKLELYDLEKPFIAVPITNGESHVLGAIAVQPDSPANDLLADYSRFVDIIANLVSPLLGMALSDDNRTDMEKPSNTQPEVRAKYGFENMVEGNTPAMRRVFEQVRRVAKWDSTVLILGESGTGKELIASAIHYNSPRAHRPLVRLNCAALPESLLESELFGHEKGAFTGAVKQRKGRFEQADGGTLFLDEIGEISPMFQAKLLRVLQEGELERVGSTQTLRVNVRIVAATNRDLESEVEKGKFREDLYYRLNVMTIRVPPLRERSDDIPELSDFLLGKIGKQQGRKLSLSDGALRVLTSHRWPGNVRELENCLERSSIMSEDGVITRDLVSLSGVDMSAMPISHQSPSVAPDVTAATSVDTDLNDAGLDDRERVIAALEQAGWVQAKAARLLGMTPRQIAYRIQTLNISMRKF